MLELIILIALSVITARLLSKRYKVASIAHSVLFIIVSAIYLFTTDVAFIKLAMVNMMGETNYEIVRDVFSAPAFYVHAGVSTILMLDMAIFVFIPLLSIIAIVKEVKEQFKELKLQKADLSTFFKSLIILVFNPFKDFKHTQNETYLILGRLLN